MGMMNDENDQTIMKVHANVEDVEDYAGTSGILDS
jgi:hypothetical protein